MPNLMPTNPIFMDMLLIAGQKPKSLSDVDGLDPSVWPRTLTPEEAAYTAKVQVLSARMMVEGKADEEALRAYGKTLIKTLKNIAKRDPNTAAVCVEALKSEPVLKGFVDLLSDDLDNVYLPFYQKRFLKVPAWGWASGLLGAAVIGYGVSRRK